jgi:hypothetical protein
MIVLLEVTETGTGREAGGPAGEGTGAAYVATRLGPLTRLAAAMMSFTLDRALAAGARPESSRLLAVRAQTLVCPGVRESTARGLRRVLAAAGTARTTGSVGHRGAIRPGVPISSARVAAAAGDLGELADRLVAAVPVPARGVALARVLLTDGAGPLYSSRGGDLGGYARAAAAALDPLAGW